MEHSLSLKEAVVDWLLKMEIDMSNNSDTGKAYHEAPSDSPNKLEVGKTRLRPGPGNDSKTRPREAVEYTEPLERVRKKRRRERNEAMDQKATLSQHLDARLSGPPRTHQSRSRSDRAHSHKSPSSKSSSSGLFLRKSPVKETFERRARRPVRADKYELKERKRESKAVSEPTKNKRHKKNKQDVKSGHALLQNYQARNVTCDRLTLQPTSVGLFNKGRASSPQRRKGGTFNFGKPSVEAATEVAKTFLVPDLSFSEIKFLDHQLEKVSSDIEETGRLKRQKQKRTVDKDEELSRFFMARHQPIHNSKESKNKATLDMNEALDCRSANLRKRPTTPRKSSRASVSMSCVSWSTSPSRSNRVGPKNRFRESKLQSQLRSGEIQLRIQDHQHDLVPTKNVEQAKGGPYITSTSIQEPLNIISPKKEFSPIGTIHPSSSRAGGGGGLDFRALDSRTRVIPGIYHNGLDATRNVYHDLNPVNTKSASNFRPLSRGKRPAPPTPFAARNFEGELCEHVQLKSKDNVEDKPRPELIPPSLLHLRTDRGGTRPRPGALYTAYASHNLDQPQSSVWNSCLDLHAHQLPQAGNLSLPSRDRRTWSQDTGIGGELHCKYDELQTSDHFTQSSSLLEMAAKCDILPVAAPVRTSELLEGIHAEEGRDTLHHSRMVAATPSAIRLNRSVHDRAALSRLAGSAKGLPTPSRNLATYDLEGFWKPNILY